MSCGKNIESAPIVLDLPYIQYGAAKPKAQIQSESVENTGKPTPTPQFSPRSPTLLRPQPTLMVGSTPRVSMPEMSGQNFLPVHFEIRWKKKRKTITESNKKRGETKRKMANKNERRWEGVKQDGGRINTKISQQRSSREEEEWRNYLNKERARHEAGAKPWRGWTRSVWRSRWALLGKSTLYHFRTRQMSIKTRAFR